MAAKRPNSDLLARQLWDASLYGENSKVLDLLEQGADPNNDDYYKRMYGGRTPLMWACAKNYPLITKHLLEWGARSDTKDGYNWTALHYACSNNSMESVRVLMSHNSPTDVKNTEGNTPVDYAREKGYSEIEELITNHTKPQSRSRDLEKQRYIQKLDELMKDTKSTILLYYLKMHFIGSSGLGKTTTRKRLTEEIRNLVSLSEEKKKRCSTNLAEFSQVLAFMDEKEEKLTLKASSDPSKQMQALFAYVYSSTASTSDHTTSTSAVDGDPLLDHCSSNSSIQSDHTASANKSVVDKGNQVTVTTNKIIARLQDIVGSGEYSEQLGNKILLNLVDVGGQPGFLEMLPSLSKGPGMFLAFFRLDKDLDELCEVSYERESDKITPFASVYTIRETLSQILSAIKHHVKLDSALDQKLLSKQSDLASLKPVATIVGTFKDKLDTKVKAKVLHEMLSTEFPKASENEKDEVIEFALANHSSSASQSSSQSTAQLNTDMQSKVEQLLTSEVFAKEVKRLSDQELKKKNDAMSSITCNFKELLFPPADHQHFIAIDNFTGTEADIDPLRKHLQKMFKSFFKGAQLRIRPPQLLLGIILRKEYNIVSMNDCIHIGEALNMSPEEVQFTVWYLDRWVGALIYQPEIENDWFKTYIICSPQVVFDSISSLIVESILVLHCPEGRSRDLGFTAAEKQNWAEKGQFSIEMVKRCHSEENKEKIKQGKLIPVEMLVKFLEHSNLLSIITIEKMQSGREVMCFIPAILECASPGELKKAHPPDADTPSPIKITFASGYVPIGVFCAMIGRLVSRGSEGILGVVWELVESGVKRNRVSFRIDGKEHSVTLIAHVNCFEIRVIRQDRSIGLNDLCSYVLSAVIYVMKEINNNISPIIAFDCKCGRQRSLNHYCQLSSGGMSTTFNCNRRQVTLTTDQEHWFAKAVTLGDDITLDALPFVDPDPNLSFKWMKPGKRTLNCIKNVLTVAKVAKTHCKDFYTCEISKDKKPYFNIYYCLRATKDDAPLSDEDHLFDDLRQAIREIRADWYSLAIELGIDYGTRKVIEHDYRFVDVSFHAVLRHWVRSTSPPLTWTALVRALKSPVISRGDIAEEIETTQDPASKDVIAEESELCDLQSPLSVDKHLKIVREVTWDVRSKWYDLGIELRVSDGTLKTIKRNYDDCDLCYTSLLEKWLTQIEPQPSWADLVTALQSPSIECYDIASQLEAMIKKS